LRFTPSKAASFQAASLEYSSGTARAKIVATKLLFELFVAMHDPDTTFDVLFRRITLAAFAHRFEKNGNSSKAS
jgi:hypothetical protein